MCSSLVSLHVPETIFPKFKNMSIGDNASWINMKTSCPHEEFSSLKCKKLAGNVPECADFENRSTTTIITI